MRQSRDAMGKFFPRTWEDVLAVTKPDHPHNTAWRQVGSYFEMAYGFARHGVVNPDFLAESTAEGCSCSPRCSRSCSSTAPKCRVGVSNAEWLVANSAAAKQRFELFQKRVRTMIETADALQARTTARATGSPPRDR